MFDPLPSDTEPICPPSDGKALEWITALAAEGLAYHLTRNGTEWQLQVPPDCLQASREAIRAYEEANIGWPPQRQPPMDVTARAHPLWSGLWGSGFIVMVYTCFGPYVATNPWLRAAASDSTGIRQGEWWRPITALTLHADLEHLLSNAVFLAVLGGLTSARLGMGLGWALILVAGIAGNLLTALAYASPHISVGASTSVFGALGILAMGQAIGQLRQSGHWRSVWSRVWLPICAAVAMLGLYGTSPHSDIIAHGAGFLCGMAVIVPYAATGRDPPGEWVDAMLKVAGVVVIMLAWRAAIQYAT